VPAVPFSDPFEENHCSDAPPSADAAHALLHLLIGGGRDCRAIGRRALAIAWATGALPEIRTQADLARRLGVTPARASQLVADLTRAHREKRRAA
jgi:hypothetical protein